MPVFIPVRTFICWWGWHGVLGALRSCGPKPACETGQEEEGTTPPPGTPSPHAPPERRPGQPDAPHPPCTPISFVYHDVLWV